MSGKPLGRGGYSSSVLLIIPCTSRYFTTFYSDFLPSTTQQLPHVNMSLDRDLEFGVPHQPSSDVQIESKEQIQDASIMQNDAGTSNPPASDHSITTIFDFDESGKYKRQALIEGLPSLPCLRVILRKLNASSFDDGLEPSLDEKELTSNNEGKVQQDADSEAETRKFIGAFFKRVLGGRTSKVPSHPSFGIWELFRLWAKDSLGFFPIVDPIFDDAKLEITLLNEPWLLERSHILYLTQYGSAFYMLPAEMRTKNLSEKHLQGAKYKIYEVITDYFQTDT